MILTDASLKVLSIISHAGNANKTTVRYYCSTVTMAKIMKSDHTTSWQRCGQSELSCPAGGNVERHKPL